jgi:hypothetical protein
MSSHSNLEQVSGKHFMGHRNGGPMTSNRFPIVLVVIGVRVVCSAGGPDFPFPRR